MPKKLTVVISQSPSKNPAKRQLEEDIVAGLLTEPGIDVTIIPNLYDLKPDSTGMLALQSLAGDMVAISWMFERAAHWILDRNNIHGHLGETLLDYEGDEEEEEEEEEEEAKPRVIDKRAIPNRRIFCLDLRVTNDASAFIDEVKRIHVVCNTKLVSLNLSNGHADETGLMNGSTNGHLPAASPQQLKKDNSREPSPEQMKRFANPTNDTALPLNGDRFLASLNQSPQQQNDVVNNGEANGNGHLEPGELNRIEGNAGRRWYPVIDYSRCTNCMECIDFCLFGVYGVDSIDTILVEQPDNCRKGCPACSRVCPENAIIFPQHKTPAIAGSPEVGGNLKIDLSQLFGAPEQNKSAVEIAAIERDEQLQIAGRDTVGMSVGIPKRSEGHADEPKDELDDLINELDGLDV